MYMWYEGCEEGVSAIWEGESCQGSVTVVEHSEGSIIVTREVCQLTGSVTFQRKV